jgi:hypothetical protein
MTATNPTCRVVFGFAGAIALTLTAALTSSLTTTAPATLADPADQAGAAADWTMIFNDEFSGGPHPDSTLWVHRNPPQDYRTTCRRNGSHPEFTRNRNTSNKSVAQVSGGYLRLLVHKHRCTSGANKGKILYKSGHIGIRGAQWFMDPSHRWKIQARIKFPKSSGNHAALWMRGVAADPPQEVDIAESFGVRAGCKLWTNYYPSYAAGAPKKQVCLTKRTDRAKKPWMWHFYKAIWVPGHATRIYIDSHLVHTFDAGHTPSVTEVAILSNLVNDPPAGQSNRFIRPGDVPSSMKVDWIRIFSKPM